MSNGPQPTALRPLANSQAGSHPAGETEIIPNAIAIASGKGGVGKTWLSITLTHALANLGRKVVLLDGDLGLANIDIQLGITPHIDLGQVLDQQWPLERAITPYPDGGFDIVAGRSGSQSLANMPTHRLLNLSSGIVSLGRTYDHVVIDLGAGIDRPVRYLATQSGRSIIVTTDEPTALTDAYAFIKLMRQQGAHSRIGVVVNMAASREDGMRTYETLAKACESFLQARPELLAVIQRDSKVKDSIRAQMPLLIRHPGSHAGNDVEILARRLANAAS
ncbi:MAG: cobyrinic acid a,c-diamide synthase [Rhodospirillaceae bacterium]|nr:MAG: cobyrinic acid a,c-diamide synthase [Rhodospirillaceae bacterium]